MKMKTLCTHYLFACSAGTASSSPAEVFYKVEDNLIAESLCALFKKASADGEGLEFHHKSASLVSLEERVLLDESLDWLNVYQDPDPGLYDPEPPKDLLRRAQYAIQAAAWEHLLKRHLNSPEQGAHGTDHSNSPQNPDTDPLKALPAEDRRNSGLILLILLAQAYYKMLECTISMASWFTRLDLELNSSYLWVVQNLTNLLANHEDLKDFPLKFEPLFPDLYPSTISDLEWQDMVAPDS